MVVCILRAVVNMAAGDSVQSGSTITQQFVKNTYLDQSQTLSRKLKELLISTKIGAQSQRPLAIVVVGGMITTLVLTRYLMPVLYSFYGHREPPAGAGSLAH